MHPQRPAKVVDGLILADLWCGYSIRTHIGLRWCPGTRPMARKLPNPERPIGALVVRRVSLGGDAEEVQRSPVGDEAF
jgi:hypothetical protein